MGKTWFTSDTHFGHKKVIEYCNRPFSSVEEMDETLIKNWNSRVGQRDTVYHLGDVGWHRGKDLERLLNRLNGDVHLVYGNHDKEIRKDGNLQACFASCRDFAEVYVQDPDAKGKFGNRKERQKIVLCHFALRVWNKSHHGSWSLYGHSHGSLPDDPRLLSMDVGVDPNDYFPVSYEEVKRKMLAKRWEPVDRHGREEEEGE